MQSYWDDMEGHTSPMVSQFIQRNRISVPDKARKEQAKTWDFIWDDAGACWRCWRCLVTVQQFKNLKRHYGGVKCRQRSGTLACQSSRQMLRAGGFMTEPDEKPCVPVEFKSHMPGHCAAQDVASADPKDSQTAVSEPGYSMTHFHHPSFPLIPSDGYGVGRPSQCLRSTPQEHDSDRLPLQQACLKQGPSESSFDLVSSVHRCESGDVVMPMTDSGEVDRLAVLCHCAYASQFSEDPEDIFKYACIDAMLAQSDHSKCDSGALEPPGPFPEAAPEPPILNPSSDHNASTLGHDENVKPGTCGRLFHKVLDLGSPCKKQKSDWWIAPHHCQALRVSGCAPWF
eukprot:jgi/Ulvmu1/6250/UM028_0108.1